MRRFVGLFVAFATVAGLFPATGSAAIFTGSGASPEHPLVNVSAKAEFSILDNVLTIILRNTTTGGTTAQGDALTGVVFDIKGTNPTLVLSSITLTSGSKIYTNKTTSSTSGALAGSWTNSLAAGVTPEFGVATTGFKDLFQGNGIKLGNSSPDYGIIAGTGPNGTGNIYSSFDGAKYPFIDNSLTFKFTGALGLSDTKIENVKFLFGTNGGKLIPGSLPPTDDPPITTAGVAAPEPGSLIIFGLLFAIGGAGRLRRRSV